jgi:hypothetical protein
MIKKAFIITGIFVLIQLIFIACCKPGIYFSRITDLKIANCSLQTELGDSLTVSQNDFRIRLRMEEEAFAQFFSPNNIINSAYATSCEDNLVGLKSDIVKFEIRCNKSILGIPAGEPIDFSKLRVYHDLGFTDNSRNQRITIPEWILILNNDGYQIGADWYFEYQEPLNTDDYFKFNVLIKQEDGTEFNAETNSVKIE